MITREADYAIRAVLSLARRGPQRAAVSSAELAAEMDIPYRFLRRIVRKLVQAKLVESQRGSGGGLRLRPGGAELSLLEVLRAMDSRNLKLNTCLSDPLNCQRSTRCRVHTEMSRLQELLEAQLGAITIGQVMTDRL